jgi:hypothetical protein
MCSLAYDASLADVYRTYTVSQPIRGSASSNHFRQTARRHNSVYSHCHENPKFTKVDPGVNFENEATSYAQVRGGGTMSN